MVGAHFPIHSIHIDLLGLGKVVRGSVYSTKVPRTKKCVHVRVCVCGGGSKNSSAQYIQSDIY